MGTSMMGATRRYSSQRHDNMKLGGQAKPRPVLIQLHREQLNNAAKRIAKAVSTSDILEARFHIRKAMMELRAIDKLYNPQS